MKPQRIIVYCVLMLFILAFSMACHLNSWQQETSRPSLNSSGGILSAFLGESRGIFSTLFFIKADVYFHRGFYPDIFEMSTGSAGSRMMSERQSSLPGNHSSHDEHGHNHKNGEPCPKDIVNQPLDWVDKLSRSFYPSVHIHADETPEGVRELLPWLKLSAAFDPHRIETYTVAAFWLRTRLGKVAEAEEFLRDGLRANPGNPELLFELGKIYRENRKDNVRARNLWELALSRWRINSKNDKESDTFVLQQILAHLAYLEREEKNYEKAIEYFTEWKKYAPNPRAIEKQIEELKSESGKN